MCLCECINTHGHEENVIWEEWSSETLTSSDYIYLHELSEVLCANFMLLFKV